MWSAFLPIALNRCRGDLPTVESEPAMPESREEVKRDGSEQDLGVPKSERGLQNCIWRWSRCFHKADVANPSGVTSDDSRVNNSGVRVEG